MLVELNILIGTRVILKSVDAVQTFIIYFKNAAIK